MHPHHPKHILPNLSTVARLAREAGATTLNHWRQPLAITDKGRDQGIVTAADLASEAHIISSIRKLFPSHAILAEESGLSQVGDNAETPIWIIDPLDGTSNFSKGNPYYCVSIAFGIRSGTACEILLAAIHHPATGDLYCAERGKGASVNGADIHVSSSTNLRSASFATGFAGNKDSQLRPVVEAIFAFQNCSLGTRVNGAAALDLALTARGIFEGFFEKGLMPWDMAAGALILSEAGGIVTDLAGGEFQPLQSRGICGANRELHEQMLEVIRSSGLSG